LEPTDHSPSDIPMSAAMPKLRCPARTGNPLRISDLESSFAQPQGERSRALGRGRRAGVWVAWLCEIGRR
jgi:hypothetical protein